jgi:cytochrome c biogenesis protein CcmG/thiol:disulfide interchange protein DsbE
VSVTDEAPPSPGRSRHTARNAAIVAGVVLVALIALLATRGTSEPVSSNKVGQAAPDVTGETLDGEAFRLSQHRGEWVLVNFFATWCVPCRIEHPELVRYAQEHADDDVQVVSVAFDDQADAIAEFFAEEGGDWPVLASETGRIALDYGVTGVPETYVVAPSGLIVARIDDGFTVDKMDAVIESLGGLEATTGAGA